MYEDHPDISTPPDETVIWRYMDLERLLALLCDKSLFMCRIDQFCDPWEGVWPDSVYEEMKSTRPPQATQLRNIAEYLKISFFVSCWHASEHESAALWDSYAARAGLAIKSTCGRLKSAVTCEKPFYIGEVSYVDYLRYEATAGFDLISPAFLKRKSFEHEREVRVLIREYPTPVEQKIDRGKVPKGMSVRVDLAKLIDAIYLTHAAPNWLLRCVRELLPKLDLRDIHVYRSDLYDKHVY